MRNLQFFLALGLIATIFCASAFTQQPERKYVPGQAAMPSDEVGERLVIFDERPHPRLPPSGWMPDGQGVALDTEYEETPYAGKTSIRLLYNPANQPEGWVAVAHLVDQKWTPTESPLNVYELIGAKKGDPIVLRLQARSTTGTKAKFEFGGGEKSSVPFAKASKWTELNKDYQLIEIDLTRSDLSAVTGKFFTYVVDNLHQGNNKMETYDLQIDNVYITKVAKKPAP